ncbi:MAG: hypothetical protein ACI90G_002719 [Urechidicola sp.]|jgi:hypothetical protein
MSSPVVCPAAGNIIEAPRVVIIKQRLKADNKQPRKAVIVITFSVAVSIELTSGLPG